jgi:hypothetical protein
VNSLTPFLMNLHTSIRVCVKTKQKLTTHLAAQLLWRGAVKLKTNTVSAERISRIFQRSGDIIACATRMKQFSSEMQQTWHIHYPRPQEQLLLQKFFYKFRP